MARHNQYVLLPMAFVATPMVEVGLLEVGVETFGTLHRTVLSFLNHYQVEATTQSYEPEPSFSLLLRVPHVIPVSPSLDLVGVPPLVIPTVYSHHTHSTHLFVSNKA